MLPTGSLIDKDPDASAWPKGIDWTDYLALIDAAETIVTSAWAITTPPYYDENSVLIPDTDPLQVTAQQIVSGSKKTLCNLAGGTDGFVYTVTNSIVTSSGVLEDRSFKVLIENL